MRRVLGLVVALLLAPTAAAQVERYELGRRLKRFEAEWERVTDPAARKRALAILPAASTQFLTLNLTGAARTVDDAYWALKAAEPPAAGVRWLDSLCVVPDKRLVPAGEPVVVTVRHLYPVPGPTPAATATAALDADDSSGPGSGLVREQPVVVPLGELPARVKFAPPNVGYVGRQPVADFTVNVALRPAVPRQLLRLHCTLTVATKLGERTAEWRAKAGREPDLEAATLRGRADWLDALAAGEVPENDPRLYAVVGQTEAWLRYGEVVKTLLQPGDNPTVFVPTGKNSTTPCRLFVPEGLKRDKPVPLVVALHGAGGSENMFFESYGAGHIVQECRKRGWLLVAPRCGLLTVPPVAEVVARLAERYPIDPRRVYLVGHSMGAGQAAELVQRHPGTFAALAVLGGGGRVRQPAVWADLPVFVGMGTADFARRSGRAFQKALADAGAKRVTAKEYDGLEHLLIVREALPDVFREWDTLR